MKLEVYPCLDSFVGKFVLPSETYQNGGECDQASNASNTSGATQTVVILDRSGSMGNEVSRITSRLLPAMFRKLRYKDEDQIVLITFDSIGSCEEFRVWQLEGLALSARGCTEMSTGLAKLMEYFPKLQPNLPLRIIVISDGEVSDKASVLSMSDSLSEMFRSEGFAINAQGFRWFTSSCQPDTKALASILKLNTTDTVILQDVNMHLSDSELIDILVRPYVNDNLDKSQILRTRSKTEIMLQYPWQDVAASEIFVRPGENLFWFSNAPVDGDICLATTTQKELMAESINIPVILCDPLTSATYLEVMYKKIHYYIDHLKILKVNETSAAAADISKIVLYFTSLERDLEKADEAKNVPGAESMKAARRLDQLQNLIMKRERSIINKMKEIANDDKISRLSAQQTAEYLRKNLTNDNNMKGLAHRIGDDLDFTGTARSEIRAMYEHLDELSTVDDTNHAISFLDLETTLSGIRTACELVDRRVISGESLLDSVSCSEILRLLNIVGIACKAPVGTFPDAMTWRVDKMFLGTLCSVSDILVQCEDEGKAGSVLLVPRGFENEGQEIMNVIPYFEDINIHLFMKKYASKLLELSAGEGMRRLLGGVSGTFLYTICAGLIQLVSQLKLKSSRSELYLNTLTHVVKTFAIQSGGYFDHILPYLHDQVETEKLNLCYFLNNNGMTNMMYPILQILLSAPKYLKATSSIRATEDNTSMSLNNNDLNQSKKLMPRILRSIYSHEVWQAVKRTFKNQDNAHLLTKAALLDILGIDLMKYKTILTPLFEKEASKIIFYDKYHINELALDEFIKSFWYLDSMILIPLFLESAYKNDLQGLQDIPELSDDLVLQSCDISYDVRTYRFYNIIQALMFNTKALRINDGNEEEVTIIDEKGEVEGYNNAKQTTKGRKISNTIDTVKISEDSKQSIDTNNNTDTDTVPTKVTKNENKNDNENDHNSNNSNNNSNDNNENDNKKAEVVQDYILPRMRIIDLKNQIAVDTLIRNFVIKQYSDQYQHDLALKGKAEQKEMKDQLIESIINSISHEETVYLYRNGIVRDTFKFQIFNSSSYGFIDLKKALLDLERTVPRRLETIQLLLLGVDDEGEAVWNDGRALFSMDITEYETVFIALNQPELWSVIRAEHRLKNKFEYNRVRRNRHNHGGDRPSYYAMGYATLEHFMGAVTTNEITIENLITYCKEHSSCCGVKRITKNRYSLLESVNTSVSFDDNSHEEEEESKIEQQKQILLLE